MYSFTATGRRPITITGHFFMLARRKTLSALDSMGRHHITGVLGRGAMSRLYAMVAAVAASATVFAALGVSPTEGNSPAPSAPHPRTSPSETTVMRPALSRQSTRDKTPATLTVVPPPQEIKASKPKNGNHNNRASDLDIQIKQLHRELDDLKTKYTDLYPDVVPKKRQIKELEKQKLRFEAN
jgi:hypothetical protein